MAINLRSQVQLFIKCTNLKDVEILTNSDPFVEVYEKRRENWYFLNKTEVIWNELNPRFSTCIELDYLFEVEKSLKFSIFDADLDSKGNEVKGDFLGESIYTLSQIVGNKGHWLEKNLVDEDSRLVNGHIYVRAEEITEFSSHMVSIIFEGKNIYYKAGCCQVFKPKFYLYRMMETDEHQRVYASEALRGKSPKWKEMSKSLQELVNGQENRPILFELIDFSCIGRHKVIGSFQFSLSDIKERRRNSFNLRNENCPRDNLGEIRIASVNFTIDPTFLDYIYGGCSINLVIGIDFTSSNGNPSEIDSLHYIDPINYNQYQSALYAVGEILLNYDTDKQVPMYGFGAQVNNKINHCFAMNFNEDDPNASGLDEIMQVYQDAIKRVGLAGPTNFSPIISKTVEMARESNITQNNQQYFILLIITDGLISDIRDTIDIIVKGSSYAMSIIIVGVGDADFTDMDILDSDDKLLKDTKGNIAERDIVQFVSYNEYKNDLDSLKKAVLEEIPREIKNFFLKRNISPNPKIVHQDELALDNFNI